MAVVVAEVEKEEGVVGKVVGEEAAAILAKLGEEASSSDRGVLEQDPTSTPQVGEECREMEEALLHRRPFQPCLAPSANLLTLSCSTRP